MGRWEHSTIATRNWYVVCILILIWFAYQCIYKYDLNIFSQIISMKDGDKDKSMLENLMKK